MRKALPLILALPVAAGAQTIDMSITPAMDPSAIAHGILVSNIPRQSSRAAARTPADRAPAPTAAVTTYRPSAAVSARVARTLIDESEQPTPGAGKQMEALLASGQAARQYRQVAAKLGFSPTDAADALAFYMVAQWGVANDYRENVTRAQMTAVRRQVRERFSGIAGQLGSDARRQEFAEILSTQGVVVAGIHEAAVGAGNEARVAELVGMARQGARKMFGADPSSFTLTDAGLVANGG